VRLFVKGAQEKAREKIKALYGVDISDKGLLKQIVDMTKSGFGGNIDMAIRSPQIRELIELYSMATGQNIRGLAPKQLPTTISQSGGLLTQVPSYYNGTPYSAVTQTTGLAGQTVNVQLDPAATREFLAGRMATTIASNPRAVGAAVVESGRQSVGRRELAAQVLQPSLVLA